MSQHFLNGPGFLALSSGFPFDSRFPRWQGFGSIESEIGRLGAGISEASGNRLENYG